MSNAEIRKLLALAMIDAQTEAVESGRHDAAEELDALADLARDPAAARLVLDAGQGEEGQ